MPSSRRRRSPQSFLDRRVSRRARHAVPRLLALAAVLVALASSGTARVQYAPALQVDPAQAAAGEEVTVRGAGFAPDETVAVRIVHVDGAAAPDAWTVTADGAGALETSWSMPASSGRQFVVETTGAVSGPSQPVALIRGPVVVTDRREYVAGDGVWIAGRGFTPGETVTLQVTHADGTAEAAMGHAPQEVVAGPDGTLQLGWMVASADLAGPQFAVRAAGTISGTARAAAFARVAAVGADRGDYQPGETALITGRGFAPNELVTLQVVHANGQNDGNGHEPFLAAADAAGNVAASWYVDPDDSLGSKFVLTGLGQSSGVRGMATFWDAGSISLTSAGTPYTQTFDTLAGSGTSSTVPTGWDFVESATNANTLYSAGTGSSNTGDTYSFGASGSAERAFGGLQSGSLVPTIGVQFTNQTGATITSLAVGYTGEQWRVGTLGRADRLDAQFSTSATSLATGTWTDVDALDFIGPATTGVVGARDGNLAANRQAVGATLTGLSVPPGATFWLRWTDVNATGADDGLAIDDFSLTPNPPLPTAPSGVGAAAPSIVLPGESTRLTVAVTPGATPISTGLGVTCNLTAIGGGATQALFDDGANGDAVAGDGVFSVLATVATATGAGTKNLPCTIADAQGRSGPASIVLVVVDAFTEISAIQGSGATAASGTFTIEGIVVGDYQTQGSGQLRGFFVQEEDADADLDPATSEGLFVFCATCPTAVAVGDAVRVTGASSEFFGMSQLSATTAASVVVLSSGNPLPTPANVELPVPGVPAGDLAAATAAINAYFEPLEGMLVRFTDTLSVAEYFELARYGQLILSEGGRPRQFTDTQTPTAAGFINHQIDLARRTVILDDTDNRQNRPVDVPNTPYYHPVPGLSTGSFVRGGDTITGLTGVLHWSFAGQTGTDAWRIRPVAEAFSYAFTTANPRPAPPSVGGTLKVASFNVLNYFLTIDTTASNDVGTCSPSFALDCRGADSSAELDRQRAKLTQALKGLDADIVGLIEMENTPGVTPQLQIVDDLNAEVGAGTYAYIDTDTIGTDAIRVGLIYKPAKVAPAGAYKVLTSTVDPQFLDTRNRPALAQTFDEVATGARVTIAVNHFKSKGSGCGAGDDDALTGQGNCNGTRTLAARALARWLATDPTGSGDRDVLVIGDLNSYAKEDPITALLTAGYIDLVAQFGGGYSYVFDGQLGYLDHALANASLRPQVTGVAEWHINADEIPLFDHNDDVRDTGEAAFEEESDSLPLYDPGNPTAFRTSDHDPVVIGLALRHFAFSGFFQPVDNLPVVNRVNSGRAIPVKFTLGGYQGLNVFAPGSPTSDLVPCGSTAAVDPVEETTTAGASVLSYDPLTTQYTYVWKSDKAWAGSCRQLVVRFADGTTRRANFQFVK